MNGKTAPQGQTQQHGTCRAIIFISPHEILRNNPDYSYKKIAQVIEKSEATVKRAIAKLKSENKIKRIGSDKTGHWEVKWPVHHSVAVDEFTIWFIYKR